MRIPQRRKLPDWQVRYFHFNLKLRADALGQMGHVTVGEPILGVASPLLASCATLMSLLSSI